MCGMCSGDGTVLEYVAVSPDGVISHHDQDDLDVAQSEAEVDGGKVYAVTYKECSRELVHDYA